MRKLWTLYLRELLEAVRSYRLVWVPVVFIILGIMQPLVAYYMPDILAASSNAPAALLENYELPDAATVMAQALGQYGTIGMLVLALAVMNSLAGERYSGTFELLMAKPLPPVSIVAAKWAAHLTVLLLAVGLGTAGAAYYTALLMGQLSWSAVAAGSSLYALWLLCAVSLTLFFSAWLRGPAAAGLALLLAAGMSLVHSLLPSQTGWLPAALPGLSAAVLAGGAAEAGPVICALLLIIACIAGASLQTGRHKLPN